MEFLFDNPLFIFILIGIISSLFRRVKGEENKPGRPQQRPSMEMKPIQEPEIFKIPMESPVRPRVRPEKQKIEQQYVDKKKQAEAKIAALKEQQLKAAEKVERMNSVSRINTNRKEPKEVSKQGMPITMEAKTLVDGIIWSEILGPPRAKRTHRSMNKNR